MKWEHRSKHSNEWQTEHYSFLFRFENLIIQETLHDYEKSAGARVNTHKSSAIALGSWDKPTPIMDIQYHDELRIIGLNMTNNTKDSANKSWAILTAKIRAQAHRALNLEYRIRYVNDYLLARAWFMTQIYHNHILVYMQRWNLPSPTIHPSKTKRSGRIRADKQSGKMSSFIYLQNGRARNEERHLYGRVDQKVVTTWRDE